MAALCCRGSGAASPAALRIMAARNGDGRGGVLALRGGGWSKETSVRFISSPAPRSPWAVRCSPGPPPPDADEVQNKPRNDAREALKAEIAGTFRPLLRTLADVLSLGTVYDLKDYQMGILSGAVLLLVGCYKLCKAAPAIFLDAAIGYMIYKLSVVSSELDQQCKSNSLITRLLFGIILFMTFNKGYKKKYVLLDIVRVPLYILYLGTFMFDVAGLKKYGRQTVISFINLLKTKGGIKEIFRIVWYPGYVSPYDDGFDWK
ncbi:unnamed protein product [Urochloa decumbens]|uniref:Uncharacterized protein n=1 Tax=Urochloa decumbens TaxID=240449 RepID=A0ABC9FE68_9POAL